MSRRQRLDAELVRRGLAGSRQHASELIDGGHVTVAGAPATKAASQITTDTAIVVREPRARYASRGAHKLVGALDAFRGPAIRDRRCLDAGASTGGFTDVLLERGARQVCAVDVGYGQLDWRLRTDDRVTVYDRVNIRHVSTDMIGGPVDVVVADLSFISLTVVLPALASVCAQEGDMVLMVKPQFEVGKDRLGKGGVVREPQLHCQAIFDVCETANALGWGTQGIEASPLPGPSGNIEFFCWLNRQAPPPDAVRAEDAVRRGPRSAHG